MMNYELKKYKNANWNCDLCGCRLGNKEVVYFFKVDIEHKKVNDKTFKKFLRKELVIEAL